jgi:hypothetical protein
VNELPEDFRDLLLDLADAGAEFVLVGGHAVAFHGHPRATKDTDVLIKANPENAQRVYRALADFGAPLDAFQVKAEDSCDRARGTDQEQTRRGPGAGPCRYRGS